MPGFRRLSRGSAMGRRRRKMTWEALELGAIGLGVGSKASAYLVLPSETETEFVSPTLVATRLVSAERITTAATQAGWFGVGLIRWSDTNDTVPNGVDQPDPMANGDFDWIIRQVYAFNAGDPAGTIGTPA